MNPVLFFLKRAYYFCKDNYRAILGVVAACVVIVALVTLQRSCNKPGTLYTPETVEKINSASASERRAEFQKQAEQNADVVRTAANTMTIAEVNVVERNRAIADKVAAADAVVVAAKQQGRDVTSEELECVLTGNCK